MFLFLLIKVINFKEWFLLKKEIKKNKIIKLQRKINKKPKCSKALVSPISFQATQGTISNILKNKTNFRIHLKFQRL